MNSVKNPPRMRKKGIVGIGILMIFIATILVSSIAAGVLIQSTGLLQERALKVSAATQNRLVTGIQILSIYGDGNTTTEKIQGFEILTRLRAGSEPIQMSTFSVAFTTNNASFSATLNSSLIGDQCTYANLVPNSIFCYDNQIGDNDSVLEEGEIFQIFYRLNTSNYLGIEEEFDLTLQPKTGSIEILSLTAPELIRKRKVRLR